MHLTRMKMILLNGFGAGVSVCFCLVGFFFIPPSVLVFDTKFFRHCIRWWKIAAYEHHLAVAHFNSPIVLEKSILLN